MTAPAAVPGVAPVDGQAQQADDHERFRDENVALVDVRQLQQQGNGERDYGTHEDDQLGPSRNPAEWLDLLRLEREVVLVCLRAPWSIVTRGVEARGHQVAWFHRWTHERYEENAWRFAQKAGLPEVVLDVSLMTPRQVLEIVMKLLPTARSSPAPQP